MNKMESSLIAITEQVIQTLIFATRARETSPELLLVMFKTAFLLGLSAGAAVGKESTSAAKYLSDWMDSNMLNDLNSIKGKNHISDALLNTILEETFPT